MSFDFIIFQFIVHLNQLILFFLSFSSVLPNSLWPTSVLTFALSKKIMVEWTLSKQLYFYFFVFFFVLHCQTAVLENHSTVRYYLFFLSFLFSFVWGIEACDLKGKKSSSVRSGGKSNGAMLFENGRRNLYHITSFFGYVIINNKIKK